MISRILTLLTVFLAVTTAPNIVKAEQSARLAGTIPVRYHPDVYADYILVEKGKRRMTLYNGGRVLKRYKIAIGKGGDGPKVRQGDMRTPEGLYYIEGRNPDSSFHLSLKISYPDEADVARAEALGYDPGGDIVIHGVRNGTSPYKHHKYRYPNDWTEGCIAVTNAEMEEIWRMVPDGTMIAIRP